MVLPFSATLCMVRTWSLGSTVAEPRVGEVLLPFIAREAAIGQQGEFAGLLEHAAGLAGVEMDLGRGDAGGRKLADGKGFSADLPAVLEDGEGALIDRGGGFGFGSFFAREQSCDEQA